MEEKRGGRTPMRPEEIEAESFAIINRELAEKGITLPAEEAPIVLRCIHTSADFDYVRNLVFLRGAVAAGKSALQAGATIVTDTRMGYAGVNQKKLKDCQGKLYCFMGDEDVAAEAKARGVTRATVSMEKACALPGPLIFAIGNAPTALLRLADLIRAGKVDPALIIAVPVGFVHVVEAKEEIEALKKTPAIVARGRKGGSNIAACIVNALLGICLA